MSVTRKGTAARSLRKNALISVVVAAYNYGRFVGASLDSLVAQTWSDWECVVVDDGSIDETPHVVKTYAVADSRIHYVHQENQGQAAARNHGLELCRGEYVQFLDADDLLEPEKLACHARFLERCSEVDVVYGAVRYFPTDAPELRLYSMLDEDEPWLPEISGQGQPVREALMRSNFVVVNAPLTRRALIETVGPFDDSREIQGLEDWDYWIRCAACDARFQFHSCPRAFALVRSHPASMSKDRLRMYRSSVGLRRKIAITAVRELADLNRKATREAHVLLGVEEVSNGNVRAGIRHLVAAMGRGATWRMRRTWLIRVPLVPLLDDDRFRRVGTISLRQIARNVALATCQRLAHRLPCRRLRK